MRRPVKRYLQCAEQHWLPSNISKYCACREILSSRCQRKIPWIASANIKTIRPWSEDNPKIKSSSRTRRLGDLTRPIFKAHSACKNTTFRAPAISQNFTKCCACHEKWHSNFTKYCACQEKYTLLYSTLRWATLLWAILIYSHLVSTHLFSRHLFSKHLFSRHLFSKHLFSRHLFSKDLFSKHLFSSSRHLFSKHLFSKHLFSKHLFKASIL